MDTLPCYSAGVTNDLAVRSRPAHDTLTRLLAGTLAAFRDHLSPSEIAVSIAAAVMVENEARPFGSRGVRILAELVEEADG